MATVPSAGVFEAPKPAVSLVSMKPATVGRPRGQGSDNPSRTIHLPRTGRPRGQGSDNPSRAIHPPRTGSPPPHTHTTPAAAAAAWQQPAPTHLVHTHTHWRTHPTTPPPATAVGACVGRHGWGCIEAWPSWQVMRGGGMVAVTRGCHRALAWGTAAAQDGWVLVGEEHGVAGHERLGQTVPDRTTSPCAQS